MIESRDEWLMTRVPDPSHTWDGSGLPAPTRTLSVQREFKQRFHGYGKGVHWGPPFSADLPLVYLDILGQLFSPQRPPEQDDQFCRK